MKHVFLMGSLILVLLAACGGGPTTPTATPSPLWATPRLAPEHLRMHLGDGVVAAIVEGLSPEYVGKVAYVTHVPSGSQAILDRQGQVIERRDGRDGGPARLALVLADRAAMEPIMASLRSDEYARPWPSTVEWLHFIKFGDITYVAKGSLAGPVAIDGERVLTVEDLGAELYRVAFRLEGYVGSSYRSQDGDAGHLNPGTPVYTVSGYAPEFRLATASEGQVTLFEADTNPAAEVGADLLDIKGRVRSIGISGPLDEPTELVSISNPEMVEGMVEMALVAPVDQSRRDRGRDLYYIAFHMEDGTAVVRRFWPESGELSSGIMTPASFQLAVLQALAQAGALPPTDGPRITEAFSIKLAMESFGRSAPEMVPVEDAHDPLTRLMRLSEYAALTGGSIPESADSLVWVVEAEGVWSDAGIVPAESRTTFRYASVAIDAQTGDSRQSSRTQEPLLSRENRATLEIPTPTPAPKPTVERFSLEEPPLGSGVEIGKEYPFSLYVHCGIRDARFDGRLWMADPMLSDGNGNPPRNWTPGDSKGVMELAGKDLARFTSRTGWVIEFIPWPSDTPWRPCF